LDANIEPIAIIEENGDSLVRLPPPPPFDAPFVQLTAYSWQATTSRISGIFV
jgi:hypothetical protein